MSTNKVNYISPDLRRYKPGTISQTRPNSISETKPEDLNKVTMSLSNKFESEANQKVNTQEDELHLIFTKLVQKVRNNEKSKQILQKNENYKVLNFKSISINYAEPKDEQKDLLKNITGNDLNTEKRKIFYL